MMTLRALRYAVVFSTLGIIPPSAVAQGMPGALQTAIVAYQHCIRTNIVEQSGNLSLTLAELQQSCGTERDEVVAQTPENARQNVLQELDQQTQK
jgi:hypothetical protein